jgi:asparagine synthase (glutamine-hydrolysing)
MCGIAGAFTSGDHDRLVDAVAKMTAAEGHRGLDGNGTWEESLGTGGGIALGHVRLSILDLTDDSSQPMASRDGRFVLVYNGELYNYVELRSELEKQGYGFATTGDTEVVLNSLIQWGPAAFKRFNGMWGLALFDRKRKTLLLSRDRFGEKPLYFLQEGHTLWFASEIKSILAVCRPREINKRVTSLFLSQFMLNADEETFFDGVFAVPAASYVELSPEDTNARKRFTSYWEVPTTPKPIECETTLSGAIRQTFLDAVKIRLRSDVPVGVLLSGGVDSSSMAAAMRSTLGPGKEIHSISAVSGDRRFSEEPFVDLAAAASGTTSHKVDLDMDPHDALALLPQVIRFNDQPVASFSAVAHFKLMEVARDLGIVVVLSGQGADELLCGYRKYLGFYLAELARQRHLIKAASVFWGFFRRRTVLSQFSLAEARRYLPTGWNRSSIDVRHQSIRTYDSYDISCRGRTLMERQGLDLSRFSVPQLVHYEDRMSMAFCREVRLPFLDHRLVELLVPLEPEWKIRDGWTKWIFRRALNDIVGADLLWRKDKRGFLNPQDRWLKQDLAGDVSALLDGELAVCDHNLVDRKALRKSFDEYRRGRVGAGHIDTREVFAPLALEYWLREYSWAIKPSVAGSPV